MSSIDHHTGKDTDEAAAYAEVERLFRVAVQLPQDERIAWVGRQDLVDKESAELKVLEGYLPPRLSAEAVAAEVASLVAELGAAGPGDMGRVMAVAKARLGGRAEMSAVSAAVRQALAG